MADTAPPSKRELLPYQIVMAAVGASIGGIVAVLGDLREELEFTESEIGIVVTAGFGAAFVAQIWLARYADQGYGRIMAITGVAITSAGLFLMVFADVVWLWFLARAAVGFGGGLVMPGLRRAATVLDPTRVGENLGRLIIGEVGGFLAGPVVAALFVEGFGIRAPFLAFAIGLVAFLPFVWRLPPDRGSIDTTGRRSFDLLRNRRLQGALLVIGGYFALIGGWESVMPVLFKDRGGGSMYTGITFTMLAIPVLFLSRYAGRLADRVGPPKVAVIGTGAVSLWMIFFGFIPGLVWPVICLTTFGVFDAFGFTAAQVAVSRSVPEDRQAAALGLMGAIEVLGAALTALPAAILYQNHGGKVAWAALGTFSLLMVLLGAERFRGTQPAHTGSGVR